MLNEELQEMLNTLQPKTNKWIANLIKEWSENDAATRAIIQLGSSWDTHVAAEALIRKEGVTTETKEGTIKTHPAVRISQTAMDNYKRLLKFLGIEVDTIIQGEEKD
ncbi:P27 family phage terminase small subunit [candidate division KSB1 bacterium]|nr:P27 family phage terminase small subunit [candidate division KSB1 bacterium]